MTMRRLANVLFALAAGCGDNLSPNGTNGGSDAPPDSTGPTTFTSFVIDLVKNHTDDTTQPVAFDQFSMLPDPDLDDPDPKTGGYATLFQ